MKLEIIENLNKRHKLTISPSGMRITIKIAKDSSEEEKKRVISFFESIYEKIGFTYGVTLRGVMHTGSKLISLTSDAGHQVVNFRQEACNVQNSD